MQAQTRDGASAFPDMKALIPWQNVCNDQVVSHRVGGRQSMLPAQLYACRGPRLAHTCPCLN
jgi:hypothetical protein